MKYTILSICDSTKHFKLLIDDYSKRFWKNLQLIDIKPSKNSEIKKNIQEDTKKIKNYIENFDWFKILLSLNWKNYTTQNLFENLNNKTNIIFIIWWPHWLDENILENDINLKVCLTNLTLNHILAKLIVLEQIYRIFTLENWKKYNY